MFLRFFKERGDGEEKTPAAIKPGEIGGLIQPRTHLSKAAILSRKAGPPLRRRYRTPSGAFRSPATSPFALQTGIIVTPVNELLQPKCARRYASWPEPFAKVPAIRHRASPLAGIEPLHRCGEFAILAIR